MRLLLILPFALMLGCDNDSALTPAARALAGTGDERILLEVDSGEDATQATTVAARILAAL